jgi:hypothetical protein
MAKTPKLTWDEIKERMHDEVNYIMQWGSDADRAAVTIKILPMMIQDEKDRETNERSEMLRKDHEELRSLFRSQVHDNRPEELR